MRKNYRNIGRKLWRCTKKLSRKWYNRNFTKPKLLHWTWLFFFSELSKFLPHCQNFFKSKKKTLWLFK